MGINMEYVTLLSSLHHRRQLSVQGKVLEFGAQDISAEPEALARHARRCGMTHTYPSIDSAPVLYDIFGLSDYTCIDAIAENGALAYDLNVNLRGIYGFNRTFDLVTDLGTFEHCFDIASAFRNAHDVCRPGGLIIHALPSNCNANHGYYTIQPRMIADMAEANCYEIVDFSFSKDYRPILYRYDLQTYQAYDDRDLLIYVVLRKQTSAEFCLPFDSIFSERNTLSGYQRLGVPQSYTSYIKGSWLNIKPAQPSKVPTDLQAYPHRNRKWVKRVIDTLGGWF